VEISFIALNGKPPVRKIIDKMKFPDPSKIVESIN